MKQMQHKRPNFREIVTIAVRQRSYQYWHAEDTIEMATAAAEAVAEEGIDAIINAIEQEITKREFICNFDDPCDLMWPRRAA